MILEEATYEKFGYYPSGLSRGSSKRIVVQCDGCGKVREIYKMAYRALCKSCAEKGKQCGEKNPMFGRTGEKCPSYGKHQSEEHKRKNSEAHIGKRVGENNPMWKGGVSFKPYCTKWNEDLREHIREKFGRKCFLCPTTEEENRRKLSVHHVNYDKNCLCGSECQFVPLCMKCHNKTNHNRDKWENAISTKLKNYIVGYYI